MPTDASDYSYHVEPQALSDEGTCVYEAIASLEYSGQPTTRGEIAAATGLPGDLVAETLDELVVFGAVVRSAPDNGDPVYRPADRGWSRAPDQPQGMTRRESAGGAPPPGAGSNGMRRQ